MPGVFINYRRDDSQGFAGALLRELNNRVGPQRVFMDFEDIQGGTEFPSKIKEAVSSSEVMLALIGLRWLEARDSQGARRLDDPADLVRQEIAWALQSQARVIPVLVDGAQMPVASQLPSDLQPLSTLNALQLSNGHWDEDVARLMDQVREGLYAQGVERAAHAKLARDFFPIPPMRRDVKRMIILLLGMGLVFAIAGAASGNPLFAGIGLVVIACGLIPIAVRRLRRKKVERLLETGRPIVTTYHSVVQKVHIALQGRHPYCVVTQWRNPVSKDLVQFRSHQVWEDPTERAKNRMITVVVDPNNFRNYIMDLSFMTSPRLQGEAG